MNADERKAATLPIWVIYKHPKDFPAHFVARCWLLDQPTGTVLIARALDEVREMLPEGLACLTRSDHDDPCIVESWV